MVKANFASERDLFQKASLGGLAKQGAEPLPLLYRCGYVQFLRLLVRRHGLAYLHRPDGALLDDGDYLPGVPSLLFLTADELTLVDQKAGCVPAPTPEDDEPTEALGDEPEGGPDGRLASLSVAPVPAIVGPVAPVTMPAPAVAKPKQKRKRVTGGRGACIGAGRVAGASDADSGDRGTYGAGLQAGRQHVASVSRHVLSEQRSLLGRNTEHASGSGVRNNKMGRIGRIVGSIALVERLLALAARSSAGRLALKRRVGALRIW